MLLAGAAGSGKTHLLSKAIRSLNGQGESILIYSPPQMVGDFDKWLDQQLVRQFQIRADPLSLTSPLRTLSARLVRDAFGSAETELKEISSLWAAAGESFFDLLGPISDAFPWVKAGIGTVRQFGRPEKILLKRSKEMAQKLGIAPEGRDFCAAMLLLQTSMRKSAVHWLSHHTPPAEISWPAVPPMATTAALARSLARSNRQLLICFDQLEFLTMANTTLAGNTLAVLITNAFQLMQEHPNVACVVSALSDVALSAMPHLSNADMTRAQYNQVELGAVPLQSLKDFMSRRVKLLRNDSAELAELVTAYTEWVCRERSMVVEIRPRQVLLALTRMLEWNGPQPDQTKLFEAVWAATTNAPTYALTDRAPSDRLQVVRERWQQLGSIPVAQLFPTEDLGVLRLLEWSLSEIASLFPGVSVANVQRDEPQRAISCTLRFPSGKEEGLTVLLADEPKHGRALRDRLHAIGRRRLSGRRVLVRTVDPFPAPKTKAGEVLTELHRKGFEKLKIAEDELEALSKLTRLVQGAPRDELIEWVATGDVVLPSLSLLISGV